MPSKLEGNLGFEAKISQIGLRAFWPRDVYDRSFAGITPSGRPVLPLVVSQPSGTPHISIPVRTGRTRRKRHVQANRVFVNWSYSRYFINRLLLPEWPRWLQPVPAMRRVPHRWRWLLSATNHHDANHGSNGLLVGIYPDSSRERCRNRYTDHCLAQPIYPDCGCSNQFAPSLLIPISPDRPQLTIQSACRTLSRVRRAVFVLTSDWSVSLKVRGRVGHGGHGRHGTEPF